MRQGKVNTSNATTDHDTYFWFGMMLLSGDFRSGLERLTALLEVGIRLGFRGDVFRRKVRLNRQGVTGRNRNRKSKTEVWGS